jgi:DNA-binding NarL/FixJ family response regulator
MKKRTRILLADDHDIIRRGVRPLIESEWGWEICGETGDGLEAVALAEKLKPDVVVLDVAMPGLNGVDVTRRILQVLPETGVLAFTGTESEALVRELFAAGAHGCVLKSEAGEHLIPAIKAICAREPYLGSRVSRVVFESQLRGDAPAESAGCGGLNARERQVVQLLAEGHGNKEIAAILGASVKTVETQRGAIMRKLKLEAFSELVRYAVRNHLVLP